MPPSAANSPQHPSGRTRGRPSAAGGPSRSPIEPTLHPAAVEDDLGDALRPGLAQRAVADEEPIENRAIQRVDRGLQIQPDAEFAGRDAAQQHLPDRLPPWPDIALDEGGRRA